MKKNIQNNPVVISLLISLIGGGVAFWVTTRERLAVQQAKIETLEKQSEKLTEAVTELWREAWGN